MTAMSDVVCEPAMRMSSGTVYLKTPRYVNYHMLVLIVTTPANTYVVSCGNSTTITISDANGLTLLNKTYTLSGGTTMYLDSLDVSKVRFPLKIQMLNNYGSCGNTLMVLGCWRLED